MVQKLLRGGVGRCLCWIVFFIAMAGGALGGEGRKKIEGDGVLYSLDAAKPSSAQPVEPKDGSLEEYKFVQIEVVKVCNPQKTPLTFKVFFQSNRKEKVYLGSFSLYPADNPGKFIVATSGKVKDHGDIILFLDIPDHVEARDAIRVTVKKIKLLKSS